MRHTTGDSFDSGGKFLKAPGRYHAVITSYQEPAKNKRTGEIVPNSICEWGCEVLAGTVEGQEKKTFDLTFFRPKPDAKDKGAFGRKIIDRALLALGLISDEDKEKSVELSASDFVARQFIVELQLDDQQKYLQLAYANIWHVDDPEAATVPKDEKALRGIPARFRRIGAQAPKPNGPVEEADVDKALFG